MEWVPGHKLRISHHWGAGVCQAKQAFGSPEVPQVGIPDRIGLRQSESRPPGAFDESLWLEAVGHRTRPVAGRLREALQAAAAPPARLTAKSFTAHVDARCA